MFSVSSTHGAQEKRRRPAERFPEAVSAGGEETRRGDAERRRGEERRRKLARAHAGAPRPADDRGRRLCLWRRGRADGPAGPRVQKSRKPAAIAGRPGRAFLAQGREEREAGRRHRHSTLSESRTRKGWAQAGRATLPTARDRAGETRRATASRAKRRLGTVHPSRRRRPGDGWPFAGSGLSYRPGRQSPPGGRDVPELQSGTSERA